jgi:hypothetical protein
MGGARRFVVLGSFRLRGGPWGVDPPLPPGVRYLTFGSSTTQVSAVVVVDRVEPPARPGTAAMGHPPGSSSIRPAGFRDEAGWSYYPVMNVSREALEIAREATSRWPTLGTVEHTKKALAGGVGTSPLTPTQATSYVSAYERG